MEALTLPKMTDVESSNIESLGHEDSTMFVKFKNGSVYSYQNVPYDLYAEILTADSVGKAFGASVKSNPGAYPFKRVV